MFLRQHALICRGGQVHVEVFRIWVLFPDSLIVLPTVNLLAISHVVGVLFTHSLIGSMLPIQFALKLGQLLLQDLQMAHPCASGGAEEDTLTASSAMLHSRMCAS